MLRGEKLLERLNKLEKSGGSMNEYIIQQRERREVVKRLSKDDQGKLENALENVTFLKSKMKKERALIKVIDLTKREEKEKEVEEQIKKDIAPDEGREKINYMLLKAKDQVNDAFKVLFANDSRLHQVRNLRDEK